MTQNKELLEFEEDYNFKEYNEGQVKQYLKRIGYEKDELPESTLENLKQLMLLHLYSIPYGNSSNFYYKQDKDLIQRELCNPNDAYTTKGVSLHALDIYNKLVLQKRDGYCFEQNLLFYYILLCLNYKVYTVGAKVIDQTIFLKHNKVEMQAMRHCALVVILDSQKYLVDVGYRAIGLFQPIPIYDDIIEDDLCELVDLPDSTKLQVVRRYPNNFTHLSNIVKPDYLVRTLVPKYTIDESLVDTEEGNQLIWQPLFFFNTSPFYPNDIKHVNYYTVMDQTHVFTQHLVLRKIIDEHTFCLVKMFDNQIKLVYPNGKVNRIILKDEKDRREALLKYFSIDLNDYDEHLTKEFVSFIK